CGVPAIQPVLS
nr:Chain C, Chymotrypsinogen A [Bos taurus]